MATRLGNMLGAVLLAGILAGCATALGSATEQGDLNRIRALLDQGVDINERGDCGSYGGATALFCGVEKGNLQAVRLLLERGAEVNAKTTWGATPLDQAISNNQAPMVQLLLEHGAETTDTQMWVCEEGILTVDMCTAREFAKRKGHAKVLRLLEQAEEKELAKLGVSASPRLATTAPADTPVAPISDVDIPPSRHLKPRSNAHAVVIGIESYRERLPKADFAVGDAKLVAEYLTKVLGYPEENVVVRLNDKASRNDLEKYFGDWLRNNVEPGGSVFIYYSGHGAPNPKTGDAYLLPYDGDPTFVDTTGYPLKRLYASLEKLPAKNIVVVLDSCFSGAGGRSVLAKGARPMGIALETPASTGKAMVLAASSGDQISSSYDEKGHGLLTYFFLKALQGDGDANKDGVIELAEVYEYVKPNVQRVARKQYNNEQTPQLLGSPEVMKGLRLVEQHGR